MSDFYDRLAPYYHLIFADWDASMRRRGEMLSCLIDARWPGSRRLLDVACGVGTQSIEEGTAPDDISTRAMRARYHAIGTPALVTLMQEAGFADVACLHDAFYPPTLVGTRPATLPTG